MIYSGYYVEVQRKGCRQCGATVYGILRRGAEISSGQARKDHRKLLDKAQRLVRLANEQITDVDILERLASKGVKVELVVGPTQNRLSLARLEARGVNVSQLDTTVEQPITIVDGSHARVTEPMIPGRDTQEQYIVYDDGHIYDHNQLFENLSSKAHKS